MVHNNINIISLSSYLLNLYIIDKSNTDNLIKRSSATGFIYKKSDKRYLVTNLHVASGRNLNTGEKMDNMNVVPEIIKASLSVYDKEKNRVIKNSHMVLPLYDSQGNPTWMVHPKYGRKVDVAVIPINFDKHVNLFAINDVESIAVNMSVADDVFVLGYPLALGTNEAQDLPIWKRASIASEPNVNYFNDGRAAFIIDGTTRSGMSGSPVFFYNNFSKTNLEDGGVCFSMSPERCFCFLGVYSGRLCGSTKDDNESFLGIVWKKELIDEIIEGNVYDDRYED